MIEKLFKIGEVIEYSGLSRQVIHNYTQLGLISETRRTPSKYRLYSEEVFARLESIKKLRAKGKTLMEIKEVMNGKRKYV